MSTQNLESPNPGDDSRYATVLRLGIIALAYAFTLRLALFLPDVQGIMAAIWPPGGVALAALLLSPPRQRWRILAVVFITGCAVNLLSGRSALESFGFMLANVLETWACTWLITRSCGNRVRFERVREVLALVICATAVNGITALLGAAVAIAASGAPFRQFYLSWWVSDGLAILLVTPAVIACARPWQRPAPTRSLRLLEAALLGLTWCACAWFGFQGPAAGLLVAAQPYLMCVPLIWAAQRFGTRGMAILLGVLAVISIGITVTNRGNFPLGGGNSFERLLMVQLCLCVFTITGLMLAAMVTERRQLQVVAQRTAKDLTAAQALAGIGSWRVAFGPEGEQWSGSSELYLIYGYAEGAAIDMHTGFDRIHPDDRHAMADTWAAFLRGDHPGEWEHRIIVDGQTKWIQVRAQKHSGANGRLLFVTGTNQDITERKQTELALSRLAAIVEYSDDGIIGKGLDSVITSWNKGAEKVFGYAAAEMVGTSIMCLIPEDRVSEENEILERIGRGESVEHFETIRRRKDGRLIDVSITASAIRDDTGRIVGVSKAVRDVTYRKEAEQALVRSEAALRARADELTSVLNAAPALIFIAHDPECKRMTSNQAALDLMRLPADSNTSKSASPSEQPGTFHFLKDGRELRPEELPLQIAAATGRPVKDCELTIALDDGTTRTIAGGAVPLFDAGGKVRGAIGAFLDITERRRMESKLREGEGMFRAMFEGSRDAIGVSKNGSHLYANPAYLKLFGFESNDALVGTSVVDCIAPNSRQRVIENVRRRFAGEAAERFYESRGMKVDGTEFDAEFSISTYEANGEIHSVVHIRDITYRKKAEALLRQTEEKFRQAQKMEAVGQLAGGVAHDFNNILASVLLYLGLLQEDPSIDPNLGVSLKELEKDVRRGAALTRQLLAFSRQQAMEPKVLDLKELLAGPVQDAAPPAGREHRHGRKRTQRIAAG